MDARWTARPTPDELARWLAVASPRTARGRCLWTPAEQRWSSRYAFMGPRPVAATCPAGVEVDFAHAAPDRWRLDTADGPVARYDGQVAASWQPGGVQVGSALLVFSGPADLLLPFQPDLAGGAVAADELLGRPCWRWETQDVTLWVDEATGCLLRLDRREGRLELTALEVDVDLDDDVFAVPDDVLATAAPLEQPPTPEPEPERVVPTAPFRVVWWPDGVSAHPVDGDPDVPELLLELHTDEQPGSPRMWLGLAPAGRSPRVQDGAASRAWDGDGWSFALSWLGEATDADVDRVIASTPRSWPLGVRP